MTTTAFDDKFTVGTQTIVLHKAYDTVAILRRNVADLEIALRKQTERAESYAETLRSIASYVGAGGYNADTVDAGVFEEKIRWGIGEIQDRLAGAIERELVNRSSLITARNDIQTWIDSRNKWMARAEAAEAELAKLREQKPVAWINLNKWTPSNGPRCVTPEEYEKELELLTKLTAVYAAPVPAPAVPATCNDNLQVDIREMLQWLIDQRGKHSHNHKQSGIWDDDNGAMAGKPCKACAMYDKARALLQSAEVRND